MVDDLRNLPQDQRLDYLSTALSRRFGSIDPRAHASIEGALAMIRAEVESLCLKFPLYQE